jgi:type II secretion system protein I
LRCKRPHAREGYLTVDALVALAVTTVAVTAAVALASNTVANVSRARDRLAAVRIADDLYEELYAGERADGAQTGVTDGRTWSYTTSSADDDPQPSAVRRIRIVVDRKLRPDLVIEAVLPPAPATASSN